jgi:hypothetical protein
VFFSWSGLRLSTYQPSFPFATIEAAWQENAEEKLLEITTSVQSSARRAKVVLTLPTQTGDPFFVTHYLGLSEAALQDLVRCIMPLETLRKRFDVEPHLYKQLIYKVLNEEVPLLALRSLFSPAWDKLNSEKWDEHDRFVLSVLKNAPDRIVVIDELLSLRGEMSATVRLEKTSANLLSETGKISAKVLVGSQEIRCDTLISPKVSKPFLIAHKKKEKTEKPEKAQKEEEKSSIRFLHK